MAHKPERLVPLPEQDHREWLDTMGEQPVVQEAETTRKCDAIADGGEQCQRAFRHDDMHDFAVQTGTPVDGGHRWSHWIQVVHAARSLLLDQPATEQVPFRTGLVGTPDDTHKLAQLVGLLGLVPHETGPGGTVVIREL